MVSCRDPYGEETGSRLVVAVEASRALLERPQVEKPAPYVSLYLKVPDRYRSLSVPSCTFRERVVCGVVVICPERKPRIR